MHIEKFINKTWEILMKSKDMKKKEVKKPKKDMKDMKSKAKKDCIK